MNVSQANTNSSLEHLEDPLNYVNVTLYKDYQGRTHRNFEVM